MPEVFGSDEEMTTDKIKEENKLSRVQPHKTTTEPADESSWILQIAS